MKKIIHEDPEEIIKFISNEKFDSDLPVPSFLEIFNISQKRNDALVLFAIVKNERLKACAILQRANRVIYKFKYRCLQFYGYNFFDFNTFFVKKKYTKIFIDLIINYNKKNNIDLLVLDNSLKKLPFLNQEINKVRLFDKSLSDIGFDFIASKKSVKYGVKYCQKIEGYSVEHFCGDDIKESHIKLLSKMHKKRWGSQSAFSDSKRYLFYSTNKSNKVFSIIRLGDEILAVSYCMIYNDILLFHTPVFNVDLHKHSPLQVLLYELFMFCKNKNIKEFDFGLGNENYKIRFSNSDRILYSYFAGSNILQNLKIKISLFLAKIYFK